MTRVYNFGSGPAMLPAPVLDRITADLPEFGGSGMSVMELGHRSPGFGQVAAGAEGRLRSVLGIPDGYRVLFLPGGASLQFAAVPLNLASPAQTADHVVTGHWSRRAADEAARFCRVQVAADTGPDHSTVPEPGEWLRTADAAYVAYAVNETIHGVEFPFVPDVGEVPLVADMSSTLLSRPLDLDRFGVVYAGAQKNLGIAGLTVVIVRDDLIGRSGRPVPAVIDWGEMARTGSMLNTPPTFAWYVAGLVLDWVADEGGLPVMEERSRRRKDLLYDAIDASDLYANTVEPAFRSWTNVPFTMSDPALEARFAEEAAAAGLVNLAGHRSVGGLRASLYNAMPIEGVETLVSFMGDFERLLAP
jgi:phosphoserine aminotransferase